MAGGEQVAVMTEKATWLVMCGNVVTDNYWYLIFGVGHNFPIPSPSSTTCTGMSVVCKFLSINFMCLLNYQNKILLPIRRLSVRLVSAFPTTTVRDESKGKYMHICSGDSV